MTTLLPSGRSAPTRLGLVGCRRALLDCVRFLHAQLRGRRALRARLLRVRVLPRFGHLSTLGCVPILVPVVVPDHGSALDFRWNRRSSVARDHDFRDRDHHRLGVARLGARGHHERVQQPTPWPLVGLPPARSVRDRRRGHRTARIPAAPCSRFVLVIGIWSVTFGIVEIVTALETRHVSHVGEAR